MPTRTVLLALLSTVLGAGISPGQVDAQTPDTPPLRTDSTAGPATKVFVLGTAHLSSVSDQFEPATVDSLITLLDAFGPDAIGIEGRSGRQIAAMERWGGSFDKVLQRFAGTSLYHGNRIRRHTGRTWSESNQRADSLLAVARSDTLDLGTEGRLRLIHNLIAAYRLPTAALQWKYLAPEARSTQRLLPDTTAVDLNKRLTAANESYSIGMRLAHRRGHQRLYPIDDQTDTDLAYKMKSPMRLIGDSLRNAYERHPIFQRSDSLLKAGVRGGNLLPFYRHVNQEKVGRANLDLQWRTLLEVDLPDQLGPQRLARWEARNLHSVGHIQRVVAQHAGEKVLVIVGASHKLFYDAYLRQMMGVTVVDAEEVLSTP
jgi:hypothetical protein